MNERGSSEAVVSPRPAMNVCLIGAPTANQLHAGLDEPAAARMMGELAPVGILSLAAVLEARGERADVVDLNRVYYAWMGSGARGELCDFAAEELAARDYDVFGFSTVCSSYPLTLRIATAVKRARPDATIVLGGPQASVVDVATLRAFSAVDLIVRGEAEESLPHLLDALAAGGALDSVSGITFRRDGEIVRNPDAPLVRDLDALPFPAFHLFPDVRHCRHFPLELGRGCPFACTFCSTNDFFRRRFRLKSPARMLADMRRVRAEFGISSFELVHDMFTVDRKRVVAFCEALVASGEKFTWGCSARTDCLDEELTALLARAGCRGIFFGIESGSPRMQKIIAKNLDLAESAARVATCDQHGINTAVSLIAGFPEETLDDLRATAAFFVDSLRYDHADPQLSILAPLAGTPIQKQHNDALVLDDDPAELSYRGWPQESGDHALIAAHPQAFSSFYSVPTPSLDRAFVLELRDFLLAGVRAFRPLLLALHQDSGDIVRVFQAWRDWRVEHGISLSAAERVAYYADDAFVVDFLRFVEREYVPSSSQAPLALVTLAECARALLDGGERPHGELPDLDESLLPESRPQLLHGVRIVELPADYEEVVRRLRRRVPLHDVPARPVNVAIRRTAAGPEARQLTPLSVELLSLCDRRLTLAQMQAEFCRKQKEVAGVPPDKLCLAGIEILRHQRLLGLG